MDLILYNGIIRTLDEDERIVEAIGIKDGRISFLGSSKDALKLESKEKIDLDKSCVLPGFVDTHIHILNYAFVEKTFKTYHIKSISQLIEEGREFAETNNIEGEKWLFGRGWNQDNMIEKRFITKEDLDSISTEFPIYLIRSCGHIAAGNSKAMEKIMELEKTKDYIHNINVEKGVLRESAIKLCYDAMNKPTQEDVEEYIKLAARDLNKSGITGVHTDDFLSLPGRDYKTIIKAYKNLESNNNLNIRVYEQSSFTSIEDLRTFLNEGYRTGDGRGYFKFGPIKILQDGSLGGRTALLREPYFGSKDNYGIQIYEKDKFQLMVKEAHNLGMQLAIHAIGDGAIEMAIDAISLANKENPRKDHRHGIVHVQITDNELLKRMKEENIIAYIQPVFVGGDMDIVESCIGKKRTATSYAWNTMIKMGLRTVGGSDAPVERFDVLENIQFAVTREKFNGTPEGGWIPKEKLTVDDAVKLFTKWAAYASFDEDKKGTLEIGKYADIIVLSEDIYNTPHNKIKDITVEKTIVNGKIVYKG